jgi:hypothetical protein
MMRTRFQLEGGERDAQSRANDAADLNIQVFV